MATYNFVKVASNLIGNTDIKVTSQSLNLNEFIASVGRAPYILSSFDIWSDNIAQLTQPIRIQRTDVSGNAVEYSKYPTLDMYQKQQQINNFPMDDFPFDGGSVILYDILPNSKVKIYINVDEAEYNKISKTQHLVESMGDKQQPILKFVYESLGIEEIEEASQKMKIKYPMKYPELEEEPEAINLEKIKERVYGKGDLEEINWLKEQKSKETSAKKDKGPQKEKKVETVFSWKPALVLAGIAVFIKYNT